MTNSASLQPMLSAGKHPRMGQPSMTALCLSQQLGQRELESWQHTPLGVIENVASGKTNSASSQPMSSAVWHDSSLRDQQSGPATAVFASQTGIGGGVGGVVVVISQVSPS